MSRSCGKEEWRQREDLSGEEIDVTISDIQEEVEVQAQEDLQSATPYLHLSGPKEKILQKRVHPSGSPTLRMKKQKKK